MIQANELRIGNWVTYENTQFQVWSEITKYSVDLDDLLTRHVKAASYDEIKPTPLTPEILEKCGFVKKNGIDEIVRYAFGLNPITHDWIIFLNWPDGKKYPFYRNGYHEINYLHQLQNLYFSLTGEELTFKP